MDARKWRIHKRGGKWCVFEPGWVFHPYTAQDSLGEAIAAATWLKNNCGFRTPGRRETSEPQ